MKNTTVIKERSSGMPSMYVLAGENITLAGLGDYYRLLRRIWNNAIDKEFELAAITRDFIYYIDEDESDENASVVMLDSERALVSDNYFAANDLFGTVLENKEILWCSPDIRQWQQEQNGDDSVNL